MIIHIFILLISILLFSFLIAFIARIEARLDYATGRPELNTAQNGIAFMKNKKSKAIFWYLRGLIYVFVVFVKILSVYYDDTATFETIMMTILVLFVPVCFFLYIHPYNYFREYNRMLNKDKKNPTVFDGDTTIKLIGMTYNKKLQYNVLFTGIAIIILQIMLTIRLHG